MKLQKSILLLILVFTAYRGMGQNITSPYSILGIGDIESKDYGKFFGMASTSLAMRSASYVNLNNPASLTALDPNMLNIDLNSRWRSSSFRYPVGDSFTSSYNDAAFRRMSLTFRPTAAWGLSFGIKPYSTVNYQIEEKLRISDGTSSNIDKKVIGSGGINQVYIANGFQLGKHFSVGLTASYLFGSLTRNTSYTYPDLSVNFSRNEYDELRGFQFQGGFQYTGKISEHLSHTLGITITTPTTLKGDFVTDYLDGNDSTLKSTITTGGSFKLPVQFGVGYAVMIGNNITIAADYNRSQWEQRKLDYPNAFLSPSQRFSLGFQYATQKRMQGQMREKMFVQAGLAYEQSYLSIDNNQITDMSATAGVGCNLTRLINVYMGIEVGRKGNINDGQIRESYTQVSAGVTLREFWTNTKKMRLYN